MSMLHGSQHWSALWVPEASAAATMGLQVQNASCCHAKMYGQLCLLLKTTWEYLPSCMHASAVAPHLAQEGNGPSSPVLEDALPLPEGHLGEGLHGRAGGDQHLWAAHHCCARASSQ